MKTPTQLVSREAVYYSVAASVIAVVCVFAMASVASASSSSYDYSYDYRLEYDRYYYDGSNRYDGYHDDNGYAYKPSCSIVVKDHNAGSYGYDRSITLAWSSSYATSAHISDIGSVGMNGMQAVFLPYKNSYRMTVRGPGGIATCETGSSYNLSYAQNYYNQYGQYGVSSQYTSYPTVTYAPPAYQYPAQPVYQQYVTLAQIPYTGFDFGLVGNAIYWLTIILAALGGAYLIVYSHSGHYPREFVREVAVAARNQARVIRSIIR